MKKTYLQPITETLLVVIESEMLTESTMTVVDEVTVSEEGKILSRELDIDGVDFLNGLIN
jgi:hypothetical protein